MLFLTGKHFIVHEKGPVKFATEMTLFALALSAHTTFAAEQSVPTDSSLHVKADPGLKSAMIIYCKFNNLHKWHLKI